MRQPRGTIQTALRNAVRAQTPDVLPDVLHQIQKREGLDDTMHTTKTLEYPAQTETGAKKRKPGRLLLWVASIAAALALAFGVYTGVSFYKTDAIVSFDVNPSVELRLNSGKKVVSAAALNTDAETILDGMDLKGVDLDVAVNALIGSMLKNGYLTVDQNTILISVEGTSETKRAALQGQLVQDVEAILNQSSVNAAVLGQSLGDDARLRQLSQEYGISLGKAALIDLLVTQDPLQDFAQLAALPVNDIYLLLSAKQAPMEGIATTGAPAAGAYIGEEAAKTMAFTHAGIAESDVRSMHVKLDFEDGRMVYEVEFRTDTAEYEYEIDAVNGTILQQESDAETHSHGGAVPANFIAESEARTIALQHAGLSADAVTFVKFTWYEKKGVYLYDMQFLTTTHVYSYEVNAVTGEIIAQYTKERDGTGTSAATSTPPSAAQEGYIGEEQALTIALAHAGVQESSLTKFDIKLSREDGRMVYEIEFKASGMEYDYDIDAVTGDVLDWEADRD